ncbi:eEF1A lysine and N-terminal methyltransferase isoform X3 [Dendrobium catenatum]|nr:eEF1A lysine and N-terminal methyltransferase isoform X3 [Dendrobium catenatum]
MVKDGYVDIMNIDISSIVIEMMRKRCMHIPQLKYLQMDVRDMSFFEDESFDSVIDKGFCFSMILCFGALLENLELSKHYQLMNLLFLFIFFGDALLTFLYEGTLDSLMCSTDASFSAFLMIEEVNRLLKPGGIYMLITYGDPSVRIPHLNQPGCCWKITLYIIPRAGFESVVGSSSSLRSVMEPVPLTEEGLLAPEYVLEDPDSHYIYICKKMED